jgi:hypothetical protein
MENDVHLVAFEEVCRLLVLRRSTVSGGRTKPRTILTGCVLILFGAINNIVVTVVDMERKASVENTFIPDRRERKDILSR